MKYCGDWVHREISGVAPARGRGLKYDPVPSTEPPERVAPARGRGLKSFGYGRMGEGWGRPREGAWIEISLISGKKGKKWSPPRGGVD